MDRPIIFSAPMIRAIRREIAAPGTGKTQTRRILTKLAGFGAVTEVRVERLQEISEADAVAEGMIKLPASGRYVVEKGEQYLGFARHTARARFSDLWDSLHGEGAFATSPWVVAVSFQPFETNIDRMPERQAAPVPAAAE